MPCQTSMMRSTRRIKTSQKLKSHTRQMMSPQIAENLKNQGKRNRKNQSCSRRRSSSETRCFVRHPAIQMSWLSEAGELHMRNQLQPLTGLELWRQMIHQFAGSAKTCMVNLLRQTMVPIEWNSKKSRDVLLQNHHWLSSFQSMGHSVVQRPLSAPKSHNRNR